MDSQLTASKTALHLFFTDDIYLVDSLANQQDAAEISPSKPVVESIGNAPVAATAMIPEPQTMEFKYLGKNQRNILILVNDEQNEVSDEAGRELLRKIVKSVNLTANDFALLNYAKYKGAGFSQLQQYFSSALIFSFGVSPQQLAIPTAHPDHAIVQEAGVKMIFAAELRVLDQNPAGKKALWGSLQNLGL